MQVTHATVREEFEGVYECEVCGLEAPAFVHAKGAGSARGWGGDSSESAYANAAEDAGEVASWTLAFARCPRCGVRPKLGRSYVVSSVVLATLAGLGTVALVYVLAAMKARDRGDAPLVALLTGAVVAAIVFGLKARAWLGVGKRVRIELDRATGVPPAKIVER